MIHLPLHTHLRPGARPAEPRVAAAMSSMWRVALPVLLGERFLLRELEQADAIDLFTQLTVDDVVRFISRPPSAPEGFEQFIVRMREKRFEGRAACFGIVPIVGDRVVGIVQLRLDAARTSAEWGFAVGDEYWGSGAFLEAASLVADFAFSAMGLHRLEARAAVADGRGNGALRKLGATREGILRRSFEKDGVRVDQALWSIVADDWLQAKAVWPDAVLH
jgi:ribosomal-protein-alanine N-acetyltransferase